MAAAVEKAVQQQFREYLASTGCSVTSQRRAVLAEIARLGGHFSAEELLASLRARKRRVSRATVYRTVAHLERSGLIRKIDFDEPHAHYEFVVGQQHHEHLHCECCGEVVEFADPALESRISEVTSARGFRPTSHAVLISGTCAKCRTGKKSQASRRARRERG